MTNGIKPIVYIIAGPNGSGKTTFARKFLPQYAKNYQFINADEVARGFSPLSPEKAALRAGKWILQEIDRLASLKEGFAFETTLSGKAYLPRLKDLKSKGYSVHLAFLWIPDISLSLARISERVKRGGHHIPEKIVRRRFHKGLRNLFQIYESVIDFWVLFDNSDQVPTAIAAQSEDKLHIFDQVLFDKILVNIKKI